MAKKNKSDRSAAAQIAARERTKRRSAEKIELVSDIGDIPAVVDPERRARCEKDLRRFLIEYFPQSTGLWPFSGDHERVIGRIQQCMLEGGLFLNVVYRGFGKTTICENAAIWATFYGHRKFVPVFGATAEDASGMIDSIKLELSENELLYADFPEICHAVRALEGKPQRCNSQTIRGKLTHIEWRSDTIVLPMIENSLAAGSIISSGGLTGASRGMKHKRTDGTQQRPDCVIIDDPQTDESASTPLQVTKRLNVLRKSILKLGGHGKSIAAVMNATVIRPDDLVEQVLNPKKFPAWQSERIKLVRSWSESHETLWMTDYARLRNTYDPAELGDQLRARRAATEFYKNNREKMDAGCVVSWQECFDHGVEISAIQHAYNALIDDGPDVFASEYQNDPPRDEVESAQTLTADFVMQKLNGVPRGVIPAGNSRLVIQIDVMKNVLFWTALGCDDEFNCHVPDYGTFPEQKRAHFGLRDVRTMQSVLKTTGLEETIYAGLDRLVSDLMSREWKREDGASIKPERILIDANWGESTQTIDDFCRRSPHAAILLPAHGKFVGASSRPLNDSAPKVGERRGTNWRIPTVANRRVVRYVIFDSNWWKTFVYSRFLTPVGSKGCLTLFGNDPQVHQLFAEHIVSEDNVEVESRGRTVIEFRLKPNRENHYFDNLVGCFVAASIQGAALMKSVQKKVRVIKNILELQKTAKHYVPR